VTDASTNLQLPYIQPAQAQKHVTHNEAIRALDALVQMSVVTRTLATPPSAPVEGGRYLVAAAATGVWSGRDAAVAAWQDGGWAFFAPRAGWLVWIADEARLVCFTGSVWADAAVPSVNPAPFVGVNAVAAAPNRLSLAAAASLFSHEGAGHQLKVNKAGVADTASLLFQTGFVGHAEIGLTGDDDLRLKVSADGATWREALVVDAAAGVPRVPSIARALLPAAAAGALAFVPDESGGATLAFSDGAAWRRVADRAVVS
jgi:Protein of unknown function (DUF2793)